MDPMGHALEQARLAAERSEVPVGAIVVRGTTVVAAAGNEVEARHDASAHAELLALRHAAQVTGQTRLVGMDLYVTLEPCPMCAYAISLFRIRRLVFGAYDPKGGGVEHGPRIFQTSRGLYCPAVVGGVREAEAGRLLSAFFAALRQDGVRT